MNNEKMFISRKEAASILGVTLWAIDQYRKDYPDFPCHKIGGRYFIEREAFIEWVKARKGA